ncbi:uracil-DNA glycosylase [Halalkalibaculum sp. DA3122]|uniref:uracil-DNA glycosylase n=1 Tax=Halalkalibaculum sp. DA3122 TaxID=3373607 RepID=UPI0037542E9C
MCPDSTTPDKLIQDIKRFLKREREMYGDFSIKLPVDELDLEEVAKVDETTSNSEESSDHKPTETEEQETSAETKSLPERLEACTSLEELRELCAKADVLRTDLEGTNLVFGVGNPNADLMLIGEAPGAEEDKQGEPFVGKAGQLLNKILAAIDFDREDVYIANILKHRPPNNRNPKPEERERNLPFLLKQIELVDPKLILCLGKVSAQTLLESDNSLKSMRGKFHNFMDRYELLTTYHPAALLRHAKWKRPTWEDVQMLRKRYDELGGKP